MPLICSHEQFDSWANKRYRYIEIYGKFLIEDSVIYLLVKSWNEKDFYKSKDLDIFNRDFKKII